MSTLVSAIRAVLFDADGVIQRPSPDWLAKLAGLSGDPSCGTRFVSAVFDAERPCLIGQGDFVHELAKVLQTWNSGVYTEEALKLWETIEPDPEILAIVGGLRSGGTHVALATNQQAVRARFMSDNLGYSTLFDDLFYSCELGCLKPSAEYFATVLDRLQIPREQVLFVDDHEPNVEAARGMGLQAELYALHSGAAQMRSLLRRYGFDCACD